MTTLVKNPTRNVRINLPSWFSPLDRLLHQDFTDLWNRSILESVPSINITEEKNRYIIELAAPGLEKDDFDISVDDDVMTISCEKESEVKSNGNGNKHVSHREYNYSRFSRSFSIPADAEGESVVAKYDKGILNLTVPKKATEKKSPGKKIKVQ